MKKSIIILAIIIVLLSISKEDYIKQESIRFRVIANSNEIKDQQIKKEVVKNLSEDIWQTKDFNNINKTRAFLQKELPTFDSIVKKTLEDNNIDTTYKINYGMNYFPEKEDEFNTYPAGEYESLVISIGEGKGENFWCVLFPPLCFPEEDEDVEYKSILKEWVEKYF